MNAPGPLPSNPCPHCNEPVPVGAPYCAACGYRIHRAPTLAQSTSSPEFAWGIVSIMLFVVPLASCGGCVLFTSSDMIVPIAMLAMAGGSFAIGIIMVIANAVKAFSNRR